MTRYFYEYTRDNFIINLESIKRSVWIGTHDGWDDVSIEIPEEEVVKLRDALNWWLERKENVENGL